MSRQDVNRSGEMEIFLRVVEQDGFSAAARMSGMTPSAVSKLIARLEARLGARLFNRSTRKLQLTPEGTAFYERSGRILADLEEAERSVAAGAHPAGVIRLNTSASYSRHVLGPLMPEFLAQHPDVSLDIVQTDAVIDLIEQRVDVAIRAGPMKDSSLVTRKLGATRSVIVAAPGYLERFGEPKTIADLDRYICLALCYTRTVKGWPLIVDNVPSTITTAARVRASDGEAMRELAIEGVGLARIAAFTVRADIAAGRLKPVLEAFNPGDLEEFRAVYLGQGGPLPARIRALLDFLAERGRIS